MSGIDDFLEQLASSEPVPGGGSVAALQASLAAALLVMVCNLTVGKKRYLDVQSRVLSIRARAGSLQSDARRLIDADADAYRGVSAVFALPRATDEERTVRSSRMQEALKGAIGPPLEIMRTASQIGLLTTELVEIGNSSAISDVGCALQSALAAYAGGKLNIEINLVAVTDESWVREVRSEAERLPNPATIYDRVMVLVNEVMYRRT